MGYFNNIPLINYKNLENDVLVDIGSNNKKVVLSNILMRSAFLREVVENTAIFYEYQVKDGETPEIIAHKL